MTLRQASCPIPARSHRGPIGQPIIKPAIPTPPLLRPGRTEQRSLYLMAQAPTEHGGCLSVMTLVRDRGAWPAAVSPSQLVVLISRVRPIILLSWPPLLTEASIRARR